MIPFFTIIVLALIAACIITGFYAETVPVLAQLQTPLIAVTVVFGIVLGAFIAIEIYKDMNRK